jgi:hypothetical protein
MYTFDPTGLWIAGDFGDSKLIPYGEITAVTKLNLAESVLTGLNLLKPGLSEEYMGVEGDPLHVMMIETKDGRYLLRVDDPDKSVAEVNGRLSSFRASK